MRPAVGVILAAVLAACGPGTGPIVVPPGGGTRASPTPVPKPPVLADELVQTGLRVPWDLAFAPDGRMFVTERPGNLLIFYIGATAPPPASGPTASSGSPWASPGQARSLRIRAG